MKTVPYLSVIIPAYNEEHVIKDHLMQVAEYCESYLGPDKAFQMYNDLKKKS